MRKCFILIMSGIFTLAGCGGAIDSMKEGLNHTQAVSAQLEKKLGLKSFVGFNWNNGTLTSVSVNFEGVPKDKNLIEIVDESKKAIAAEFKQTPKQITVGFLVEP